MKQLRIGVIGTGMIGVEHIRRINEALSGGAVTHIASSTKERATVIAQKFGIPAVLAPENLIAAPDVDAVVIASPGDTHERFVLQCIAEGKPVFCEKPLALTAEGCYQIMQAEMSCGKRLLQVGFMRRFDKNHMELREIVASGRMGRPLLVHAIHRNPNVSPKFTDSMEITDAAIHELDVLPWLLGDVITSCQVIHGAATGAVAGLLQDPILLILKTSRDVVIDLEIFTHCDYGYDIGCEVVCETGTVALPMSSSVQIKQDQKRVVREFDFWQERYWNAYDAELQCFLRYAACGTAAGPSAWDAYTAAAAADLCIAAQKSGKLERMELPGKPEFYQ